MKDTPSDLTRNHFLKLIPPYGQSKQNFLFLEIVMCVEMQVRNTSGELKGIFHAIVYSNNNK